MGWCVALVAWSSVVAVAARADQGEERGAQASDRGSDARRGERSVDADGSSRSDDRSDENAPSDSDTGSRTSGSRDPDTSSGPDEDASAATNAGNPEDTTERRDPGSTSDANRDPGSNGDANRDPSTDDPNRDPGGTSTDDADLSTAAANPDDYPDDPYGEGPPEDEVDADAPLRYFFEGVRVVGNERTRTSVIADYVPLERGDVIDPEDPRIEAIEWRLLGTGWFRKVTIRLSRGERHGWVVLVVEVEERNTIVVDGFTVGVSEGINNSLDTRAEGLVYGGATLTETNLFGTGARLSLTGLFSRRARGGRLAYVHPSLFPRRLSLRAGLQYTNTRQFYGNDPLVSGTCPEDAPEDCVAELEARNAVLFYNRGVFWLGTGRSVGTSTHYSIDYVGELLNVRSMPSAASEMRGDETRSIDFRVAGDDLSFVSMARVGLTYDRRNDPGLPSRGLLVRFRAELAHRVLGSDYEFLRLQLQYRGWIPLPDRHTLSAGVYVGSVFGDPPFYYLFHATDLTDLRPSRIMEMELDRRSPPNFFDTAIGVMRAEELAARADLEYGVDLWRGTRSFRTLQAYFNLGLYLLADPRDLQVAVPGFQGISKVPFDMSFDVGFRLDTSIGVFQVGFSNILGFIRLGDR